MTEAMIVEAVRSAGGGKVGLMAQQGVQANVDPAAVERFQAAMTPPAPSDIPFASQVAATWKTAESNYQGILHRIKALTELRRMHGPSAVELSELQYEVANLTFQQEVVTNIAKKASDAVSTLVKNG